MYSFKTIQASDGREGARLIFLVGFILGLGFFSHYYAGGMTTAHYDAKAHLLVARRMVDSVLPGYLQLGVSWLPLVHLIYLPFVLFDFQYQSGLIPSLISVLAFALSGALVFKISFDLTESKTAGVFAAALFMFNPNLLYLQSCPLTEPVYMALLLLATHGLVRWRQEGRRGLPWGAAVWTSLGAMCRYEGWYFFIGVMLLLGHDFIKRREARASVFRAGALFLALVGLPAVAHFGYIYLNLGDSFLHRVAAGNPSPYLTYRRPFLSFLYQLAELSQMVTVIPVMVAAAGLVVFCVQKKELDRRLPLILLWVPSLISMSALYWGLIYRVRYAALLIPAVAIFGSLATVSEVGRKQTMYWVSAAVMGLPWVVWAWGHVNPGPPPALGPGEFALPIAALVLFFISRVKGWFSAPLALLCFLGMHMPMLAREVRPMIAETLEHDFIEPERRKVLEYLKRNYDGRKILIDMGTEAPLVYDSGLRVREFIYNEGQGLLWHKAAADPESVVGWMCYQHGDAVWRLMQTNSKWASRFIPVVKTEHYTLLRLEKGH